MFWGKKKDDDREKLLKQFKYTFPSLRRPNNDDSLFEIRFPVENTYAVLRIAIPSEFPVVKPVLDVVGNISHLWIDQYKRIIGSPKLNGWNKHSNLTEVVEETLKALSFATVSQLPANPPAQANPATAYSQTNYPAAYPAYPGPPAPSIRQNNSNPNLIAPVTQPVSNYSGQPQQAYQQQPPQQNYQNTFANPVYANGSSSNKSNNSNVSFKPDVSQSAKPFGNDADLDNDNPIPLPEIPQSFPELEKLTDIQLERLLNDDVAIEKMIEGQSSVENMRILRDEMRQTNSEKASKNVVLGEELVALQRQATSLQNKLKEETAQYAKEYTDKTKKHIINSEDIFKELNKKNELLDQDSEKLGERFVNGDVELSSFLQEFLDLRIKYHTLNAKLLLTQRQ